MENEYAIKVNHVTKRYRLYEKNGDRVKVKIRFRGREMAYQQQGYQVMEKFMEGIAEFGQVDKQPKVEGRDMVMFVVPKKSK